MCLTFNIKRCIAQVREDGLPEALQNIQKSPKENSILNTIGENGLLTYTDFCFLLAILSTPKRYLDTAFELFDVTGDVKMDAKVHVELYNFNLMTNQIFYSSMKKI